MFFTYVLFVALVNLMLGFASAVYLAHRHRLALSAAPSARRAPQAPYPPLATNAAPAVAPAPSRTVPESAPAVEPADRPANSAAAVALPETAPDASRVEQVAPVPDTSQAKAPSPPALESATRAVSADPPAAASANPRPVTIEEQVVAAAGQHLGRYQQTVAEIDERLRHCVQEPSREEIQACLQSLVSANDGFQTCREEVQQGADKLRQSSAGFEPLCETLQQAVRKQSEEIQATEAAVRSFDYDADLSAGCRQIVDHTCKLLEGTDGLRDSLSEAQIGVARDQQRLAGIDASQRRDPLTELESRAGLEATLADWWADETVRTRQLCAALMDIDQFSQLNDQYGHRLGDRILHSIAAVLRAESRGECRASRFTGETFFVLFPDVDLQFATNLIERIRQTVELTHFRYQDYDIRTTVSCGVTEVTAADDQPNLLARLDGTLKEAKRYGRNRTFLHEGKYPTPVIPPNFSLEERDVHL